MCSGNTGNPLIGEKTMALYITINSIHIYRVEDFHVSIRNQERFRDKILVLIILIDFCFIQHFFKNYSCILCIYYVETVYEKC